METSIDLINLHQSIATYNFSQVDVYSVHNLTKEYITMLFLTVMTAGGTVNQECWLEFPMTCSRCHYEHMHARGLSSDVDHILTALQNTCQAIKGQIEPTSIGLSVDVINILQGDAMYEPTIRPNFPTQPDIIQVSFQLVSIENIDITDSSFKMDCFLLQEWKDYRLRHRYNDLLDASSIIDGIWMPDTYFVQAKYGEYSSLDKAFSLKVRSDGMVFSTLRLVIQISCSMDFYQFPMDVQRCVLQLESYGHDWNDVIYQWKINESSIITTNFDSKILSQYNLAPLKTSSKLTSYIAGNWSTLTIDFVFTRNSIIFIPALYFPCAIIVFISWMTFFLEHEHYPARTYLNVTSILTIVTLQAAMDSSIPKVSYIKAIDQYVLVCVFFISIAFVEYAVVLFLNNKRREYLYKRKHKLKMANRVHQKLVERNPLRDKIDKISQKQEIDNDIILSNETLSKDESFLTQFDRLLKFYLRDGWPEKIDFAARIAFPTAFIAFNVVYWITSQIGNN